MDDSRSVLELIERLPPRPPPSMDRLLDAAERCLARYGIRRTSMTDIAREMKVARTTLYRQISSVEDAIALIASRDLHRFVDGLEVLVGARGDEAATGFLRAVAGAVRWAWSDPVVTRVLSEEPDIIGELVTRDMRVYAAQTAEALAPVLERAMDAGILRPLDPRLAAGWLVRAVAALVALPPEGDLDEMVALALSPLLQPAPLPPARSALVPSETWT